MKTRKAPAARANTIPDPIFAAIAEHRRLAKEFSRRRRNYQTARAKAEKNLGERPMTAETIMMIANAARPLYGPFSDASRAKCKMGMRLARTKPTTLAGGIALVAHARRDILEAVASFLTGARSHSRRPSTR